MDNIKTGNLIKEARKGKGMTQKDLADILHITDRAVSKWERGVNAPDISLLQPLARRLDLEVMDIITGEKQSESGGQADKEALKNIIDYSQKEISRKTTALKRRLCRQAAAILLGLALIMPAVNGLFWGEGFAWRCVPAYICAEKAAAALENYDKQAIEKYIGNSEDMYRQLEELRRQGVVILEADSSPARTRLEDMFLLLEVDLIVQYGDIKYRFTANGTYRNSKVELMQIAADDLEKDYPRWMTRLSDTLATYNPG